jgi:hypothetical protein
LLVIQNFVDPQAEIDQILSVPDSPYEMDSGSSTNDGKTAAQGVLFINRYDWAHILGIRAGSLEKKQQIQRSIGHATVLESSITNRQKIRCCDGKTKSLPKDPSHRMELGFIFHMPNICSTALVSMVTTPQRYLFCSLQQTPIS